MDFIRQQFDKLLVSLFLVLACAMLMHLIHHQGDQANTNQAWGVVQFFLGLFGGLVTGRAIGKAELQSSQTVSTTTTERTTDPPAEPKV